MDNKETKTFTYVRTYIHTYIHTAVSLETACISKLVYANI